MVATHIKPNLRVYDRWYPEWGIGRVVRVLKTRFKIQFQGELRTYDFAHAQFLEEA